MAPVTVHAPDPSVPEGMAFVMGAGMVDFRPGERPRQAMALVQSWEPTSRLWWELGLRWHPELATKWVVGGGQFLVGEIVDKQPDKLHQTPEEGAEEILEYFGTEHPEYAEMLKNIREVGSDEDKAKLIKQYEGEMKKLLSLVNYIKTKPKG